MDESNTPELNLIHTGNSLKTLKVSALAGMIMPLHHATREAVIVVQEGKALLKMPTVEHVLDRGSSIIIPALVEHSLEIVSDFKAIVIMAIDSNIEFQSL